MIRLSLSLIDLLEPYINIKFKILPNKNVNVKWVVGGCIDIAETYLLFNFSDESNNEVILKKFNNKSNIFSGNGFWNKSFGQNKSLFEYSIDTSKSKEKYLEFIVLAKVDKDWLKQTNPSPNIKPQTHIVNLRNNEGYVASNGGFTLKGKEYFISEKHIIKLDN